MSNAANGGSLLDFPNLPKFTSRGLSALAGVVVLVLLLVTALSSFYTIGPEETGIVLRLGRYRGAEHDAGPGLHFKLPFIDAVIKLPVQRQLKAEFGFRTEAVAVRSDFASVPDEANMLTGDLNVAVIEWVVQYRIVDPYPYLFKVRNVESTFRDMSEAVMRKVIGDRTVTEALTVGRAEIEDEVKVKLQELAERYQTGVRVDQVVLQSGNPPDAVKPSFNEVNQAEQERERLINEAEAQYNRVIPRADGEARQTIEQAEGYALDRVNRSQGDAARFNALYAAYRQAPEVTRKRMYLETLAEVLPRVGRNIVVDDALEGVVPLLNLPSQGAVAGGAARIQQQQGGDQ